MRKKIVRGICALLAVGLFVTGIWVVAAQPRPVTWILLAGGLLSGLQFGTFAATGVSPFRTDQLRDLRQARAERAKGPNL